MSRLFADLVRWKGRQAFRLSNGEIETTVLLGGGHVADLRLCGSPVNALWEAPWPTIEPYEFDNERHSPLYGSRNVGQMLSGYTGHAVAIPYFGLPSAADAKRGLTLHGEAASTNWTIESGSLGEGSVRVTLRANLPMSALQFRRTLHAAPNSSFLTVTESVKNQSAETRDFQWVQHVAFGEPLFTPGESSLILSGDRGLTWPLGYEGQELLPNSLEFHWPLAAGNDLSLPFLQDGTGFVAAIRVDSRRRDAFIAVHNRRSALAAGYVFDSERFPWIALWEENRARTYPPWNGQTRVRGVEFGTSPMPLGLEEAQRTRQFFETPVVATIGGDAELQTSYQMFVTKTPRDWQGLRDVRSKKDQLQLESNIGAELLL